MGNALLGLLMIAMGVFFARRHVAVARRLRAHGWPRRRAWFNVYMSPGIFIGLVLFLGAIWMPAAEVVFATGALLLIAWLVESAVRGAWRLPTAIRLTGDPAAWRGERRAYWQERTPAERPPTTHKSSPDDSA